MSRVLKLVQLLRPGDLIFIAPSKQNANDWVDLAVLSEHEILRSITLHDGTNKIIRQSPTTYLEQESRPIGVFRDSGSQRLDEIIERETAVPLSLWQRFLNLFKTQPQKFNWDNNKAVKTIVLKEFSVNSVKELENSGSLIRLM